MYLNKIRIIGGKWKGRKIAVKHPLIRPTPNRIRETLFNWLMPHIQNASCLDLFAGTGALGLEALSRGAPHVTFIEKDARILAEIKKNLQDLNTLECATLVQKEALYWLQHSAPSKSFDIVFVDPPFNQGMVEPVCDALAKGVLIHRRSFIYIEGEKDVAFTLPVGWELIKSRITQQVTYGLYRRL